jgi:hypothetical protein
MADGFKICFDASVRNGLVGIGIWDFEKKVKKYVSFSSNNTSSYTAEKMALAVAMEYAYSNSYKNPYYFTDNSTLAENGIPKDFIKKYGNGRLHWIPREFNLEADELSKLGSKVVGNTSINSLEDNISKEFNLIESLSEYGFQRKIDFLKRIATKHSEREFIKLLMAKKKGNYHTNCPKGIKPFVYLVCHIFHKFELSKYAFNRINLIKLEDSYLRKTKNKQKVLIEFIRSRNTI